MFVADLANQIPNPLPVSIGWEVQPRNALHVMSGYEQESQVFQTLLIFMQSDIIYAWSGGKLANFKIGSG
jgi:hypothetical protein